MNTAAQINDIIKKERFPFFCLHDANGNSVIPWNTGKPHDAEHLKKIIYTIDAGKSLPNGVYYVVCANSVQSRAVKTKLEFHRGKIDAPTGEVITPKKQADAAAPQLPAGYTFADLLKLTAELGELRAKNAALESENERLKKDIENLEDEIAELSADEPPPLMGAPAPGQPDINQLIQVKILELLTPAPVPTMEEKKPEPRAISYGQLLNLLKNTDPAVLEQLSTDLNAANNGNAETQNVNHGE